MLPEYFIYLGLLANFTGGLVYLKDTLTGKAKPNRVTWLLWSIAPLVGFAAEVNKGVGLPSAMTFMIGFMPLLVFAGSFVNKKSRWKIGVFDLVCGGLSILGLILWLLSKDANIAIVFAILSDSLAALPTIRKAYLYPETESANAFWGGTIGGLLTLLTLTRFDLANLGFL